MSIRQIVALFCAMSMAFAIGMQWVLVLDQQESPLIASMSRTNNKASNIGDVATGIANSLQVAAISSTPAMTPMEEMAELVNQLRVQKGVPPVRVNPNLALAGQTYTQRMAENNFFGHNDPDQDCNKPFERAIASGYEGWTHVSENIAAGQANATDAMQGFINSPTHYKTLVNPNLREVGIGFFTELSDTDNVRVLSTCPTFDRTGGPYIYYWAQEFGSRQNTDAPVLPVIINNETHETDDYDVPLYVYGGLTGQPAWANEMRFSQDGQTWTEYEPWQANKTITLANPPGLKTVYAELKHIDSVTQAVTTQIVSDTIYLNQQNQPGFVATAFLFVPLVAR